MSQQRPKCFHPHKSSELKIYEARDMRQTLVFILSYNNNIRIQCFLLALCNFRPYPSYNKALVTLGSRLVHMHVTANVRITFKVTLTSTFTPSQMLLQWNLLALAFKPSAAKPLLGFAPAQLTCMSH